MLRRRNKIDVGIRTKCYGCQKQISLTYNPNGWCCKCAKKNRRIELKTKIKKERAQSKRKPKGMQEII
jgi:hypothetical protein